MTAGLAAILVTFLAWRLHAFAGWTPVVAGVALWSLITCVLWWNPLHLMPLSWNVVAMLLLGVGFMALPSFSPSARPAQTARAALSRHVDGRKLLIGTMAAATLSLVGAYAFRDQIAASAGTGFGQLSAQQVRYYQNQKGSSAGLVSLLQACYPILGTLGVLGFLRISRWYALAVALSILLSLQNPGRLFSVSLIVQMVTVYLYVHERSGAKRHKSLYILIASGIAASLGTFVWLGDKLGKNQIISGVIDTSIPQPFVSPILYLTGGLPAMTTVVNERLEPFDGKGSSAFIFVRAWHSIEPGHVMPQTVGNFVDMPYPFNVFTGFGQAYWDGGYIWVIILSLIVGILGARAHARAMRGGIMGIWLSSITSMLMISMPMQHRLFNLDTIFELVLGSAMVYWVTSSRSAESDDNGARDSCGPRMGVDDPKSTRPRRAKRARGRSSQTRLPDRQATAARHVPAQAEKL